MQILSKSGFGSRVVNPGYITLELKPSTFDHGGSICWTNLCFPSGFL